MPLAETLMIEVGSSIARALLKRWLGSDGPVSDAATSIADILKGRVSDRIAQQRGRHQFEEIGMKVGESLLPVFAMEGASLDEGSRTAVAMAVGETLNTASSALLAQHDLEPVEIARQLLTDHPARSYHFSDTEGRLYEQIVNESCRYIVDIASQLPHFTESTVAEVLKRQGYLVEIAERIVQEIARLRTQLNPQVEVAQFELEYRLTVRRKLDKLELFGTGISVTIRDYSLSLAYIPLSLEYQIIRPAQEREEDIHRFRQELDGRPQTITTQAITDLPTLLAESSYLLIRGEAGSGKTTLMQWIAVQSAAQCFPPALASWNGTIPFFIRLRQHVPAEGKGEPSWPAPEAFPGLVAPMVAGSMPLGWVHRQLQDGRAIVLVDGIDEVPTDLRPGVYKWLEELVVTYPQARFIVTTRHYAASKEDLPAQERLKEAQVKPMDMLAVEQFVTQWHHAVAENLQDAHERQELQEAAARLVAQIDKDQALQQLAINPLLCAMLCALSRERHQHLPSNRVTLYEACCELLIERRDKERRVSLADYPAVALSYEQKTLLLSDLAYWLLRNGQAEAEIDEIDQRLTRRLRGINGVPSGLQGADARQLFIERSGILREPVKGMVDFAHRTFQEFLAAKEVVDGNEIRALAEQAHDDRWGEVAQLTVGLASRPVREKLVECLLERGETDKRYRSRLYILAAACAQAAREEMSVDIRARIERDLAQLMPLKSEEEVEAITKAGAFAIPYLAPRLEYGSTVAAACVRALLQIGSEAALNALEAYTTDDTPVVIAALVLGLRDAPDKAAYAQRFLSHVEDVSASPGMLTLLPFLPHLSSLKLSGLMQVRDLSVLVGLPALSSLALSILPQVSDLSVLAELPALSSLKLSRMKQVSDLSVLAELPALSSLELFDLEQVRDLSVLARLPALNSLELSGLEQVRDLSVLERLGKLTKLSLGRLPDGCVYPQGVLKRVRITRFDW